jgi:hypothetical protein
MAAGVRLQHPEYDDVQVKRAVIKLSLGDFLFHKAFPDVEIES